MNKSSNLRQVKLLERIQRSVNKERFSRLSIRDKPSSYQEFIQVNEKVIQGMTSYWLGFHETIVRTLDDSSVVYFKKSGALVIDSVED